MRHKNKGTMCIQSAKRVLTKGKPIMVYKVILRCKTLEKKGSRYETPFRGVAVTKEVLRGKQPFEAGPRLVGDDPESFGVVNSGYIHTYADLDSVMRDYNNYYRKALENNDRKVLIYECEVPADQDHVWYGTFDDDGSLECIAAKKIIFRRKLTQQEIDNYFPGQRE